jgi:hypothetical protein
MLMTIAGFSIAGCYLLFFDTTVESGGNIVHNAELLSLRREGILHYFNVAAIGCLLLFLGRGTKKKDH